MSKASLYASDGCGDYPQGGDSGLKKCQEPCGELDFTLNWVNI